MKLAPRLVLISVVTLGLPWAGCQYLRDVEQALRDGQADTLAATTSAIAGLVASRPERLLVDPGRFEAGRTASLDLYAHPLPMPPVLDGFGDDWNLPASAWERLPPGDGPGVRYGVGEARGFVYLLLEVEDDRVRYDPGDDGDAVLLRLGDPRSSPRPVRLSTPAPGPLLAQDPTRPGRGRIEGNWQPTSRGYNLELRIPAALALDRLGFLVLDRDGSGDGAATGSLAGPDADPGWLVWRRSAVDRDLALAVGAGIRVRLLDPAGFVLADAGAAGSGGDDGADGIGRRLLRFVLGDRPPDRPVPASRAGWLDPTGLATEDPAETTVTRFRSARAGRIVLVAARPVPITAGAEGLLVAEQDLDAILSLTDQAAFRLFGASFLVGLLAAGLLLAFAVWLSLRIRRLSAAARAGAVGRSTPTRLPEADSADEIGDLSRSFSKLLTQVRDYNLYLESLRDKLTHELRTPMTVVRTSLENLRAEPAGPLASQYLARAQQGIERLQRMVTALGAATRMEEAIATAEDEPFDLAGLVRELGAAYQTVGPRPVVEVLAPAGSCPFVGAPELIAQACDKLVENARDFCPEDGTITLALDCAPGLATVSVANTGSRLPRSGTGELFDSLVSHRSGDDGEPHLGLGLYVVRLVAGHHGGDVAARNLPGGEGVVFEIRLPRAG